jgi:hypothetical protein
MTSRGRGVSVIFGDGAEQLFWVEKKIWLKGFLTHLHFWNMLKN